MDTGRGEVYPIAYSSGGEEMKIVTSENTIFIHPFVLADGEPNNSEKIIAWPDGGIMVSLGRPMMNAEAARKLAQALLHAMEMVEKGRG